MFEVQLVCVSLIRTPTVSAGDPGSSRSFDIV
jgi:hypothetical protein